MMKARKGVLRFDNVALKTNPRMVRDKVTVAGRGTVLSGLETVDVVAQGRFVETETVTVVFSRVMVCFCHDVVGY